jgi:hypothetical protein
MRKNINMNNLDKIIDKVAKINYKKLKQSQIQDYCSLKNRLTCNLSMQYFLNVLREKIKKQVSENYTDSSTEQISSSIITYNDYGFVEYKGEWLYTHILKELIEEYVKQQFTKIENNNLKLELC